MLAVVVNPLLKALYLSLCGWTAVFNSSGLEVDLSVNDSDCPYSFVSCSQLL